VVSDRFLQEVQAFYRPHLLGDPSARLLAGWCLDYWTQYRSAPGPHVRDLFESHARNGLGDAEAEAISSILAAASEEHERADHFNADYLLDEAERHLKGRSLLALAEDLKAALASPAGGPVEAERVLEEYHRIERPRSAGICPLTDREAIREAFAEKSVSLFRFGGALGELINPMLVRAGFLAFLAPPKRGKSWFLMELALRAASAGCNVAFFECGDMTEQQWLRRFHVRISHRPFRHYRPEYVGTVRVPYLLEGDPGSDVEVDWRDEPVEPLDHRQAYRTGREFLRKKMGKGRLKLSCHSSGTLTLSGVRTQADIWERVEGFVPDVYVFDYADLLAAERSGPKEFRHQENEKWKGLRGLSQERCALTVTASQSDAEGMERETLSARNFSEDMRKLAHVTGMYGLNQKQEEKREGRLRVNEIVVREGDFDGGRSVTLLQALRVGRPALASFWTPMKKDNGNREEGQNG
jgi:hypothetical protein